MAVDVSFTPLDQNVLRTIAAGTHDHGQIVMQPLGVLEGKAGFGSIVRATAATATAGSLVTSAGYGSTGSAEAIIRGLAFDGAENLPEFPYGDAGELAIGSPVAHGLKLDGRRVRVQDCRIKNFRGDGIWLVVGAPSGEGNIFFPIVEGCDITQTWTGIRNSYVDSQFYGNVVANVRDACFWDTQGNCQTANNHFYGATYAYRLGTSYSEDMGPTKSVGDTFADARYGYYNYESVNASVHGAKVEHCWDYGMVFEAPQSAVYDTHVYVPRRTDQHPNTMGIKINCPRFRFIGGLVAVNHYPFPPPNTGHAGGLGIKLENHEAIIDTLITAVPEQAAQTGLLITNDVVNVDYCSIKVKLNGFKGASDMYGVDIEALGSYNVIEIEGHTDQGTWQSPSDKRLRIPAGWNSTNSIKINGQALTAGQLYPPAA